MIRGKTERLIATSPRDPILHHLVVLGDGDPGRGVDQFRRMERARREEAISP